MAVPSTCVVFCTCPDSGTGRRIARALVTERLAACVQIVPAIESVYRWHGRLETDDEALLIVKTREDALAGLTRRINEMHPYELPEVAAVPVSGGSAAYCDWILDNTDPASHSD